MGAGRLTPLPWLLPYLADRAADVAHIVVVADRTGADLLHVDRGGQTQARMVTGGTQYPMHRTATADWSESHCRLRVENAWQSNADDVAEAVHRLVAESATTLVVVAGDVRARSMITDSLARDPHLEVHQVEHGGRGDSAEVRDAVAEQVRRHVWRERRATLAHLQQNLCRERYGVAGVQGVADALRSAQVDTVVVSDDPTSTLQAWLGERPTDFGLDDAEADALGVTDPAHDRFDSALVRAVAGTGADLFVTPGAHDYVRDGIAALLRSDAVTARR